MTSRERQLRIENHPDRWGGDHSRMEKVYALKRSNSKHDLRHCSECGVPVRGYSDKCRIHYRVRKAVSA